MTEHIYFYSNIPTYRAFSNFYPAPFEFAGVIWPTVEHLYQASKSIDEKVRESIRLAGTPAEAKRMGRYIVLRSDWKELKEDIMHSALLQKFRQNPELQALLLSTEDVELHEKSETDLYWGYRGEDRLGRLLMKVRDEIREMEALKVD